MKPLIPLLLAVLPVFAGAACPASVPSDRVCIAWTPPTTNNDNTPVSAPLKFRIYRKVGTTYVSVVETTGVDITIPGMPKGNQCFVVTALDALARESAISNSVCKLLRVAAPTDGSIEAPSDGSIEFPK